MDEKMLETKMSHSGLFALRISKALLFLSSLFLLTVVALAVEYAFIEVISFSYSSSRGDTIEVRGWTGLSEYWMPFAASLFLIGLSGIIAAIVSISYRD